MEEQPNMLTRQLPTRPRRPPQWLNDYEMRTPTQPRPKRRLVISEDPVPSGAASAIVSIYSPTPPTSTYYCKPLPIIPTVALPNTALRCPFSSCPKHQEIFSGWSTRSSLFQHLNAIHLSKGEWPNDAFLRDFGCVVCKTCKVLCKQRGCEVCRGRHIRQPLFAAIVEDTAPPLPDIVVLSPADIDGMWKVLRSPPLVIKRIPRAFRYSFAEELSRLLNAVTASSKVVDMIRLALFTRSVLAPLPRGGKRGKAQSRGILSERLRQWQTASVPDIITQLSSVRGRRSDMDDNNRQIDEDDRLRRRIKALVEAGTISKAAKELTSSGIHRMTSTIHQKLVTLHPQAVLPPTEAAPDAPEFCCEVAEVKSAVLSFPAATAPGPSGLRADHLRDILTSVSSDTADRVLTALTKLTNCSLNGLLPSSFAEFFLSARLLPFKKPNDGVRPIAVGEVLRRLVAKVALHQVLPEAQERLQPTQVGVGVKDAVTHVAFAVRCAHQLCMKELPSGILQIDVANAFNCISRQEILTNVRLQFPMLQRWAHWSLGHSGTLLTETERLASTSGVQQGDPLGPFLFSTGIHRVITELREKFGRAIHIWYLDDGVIAGSFEDLDRLLRELRASFSAIGLSLNVDKCKLFTVGDPSSFDELSVIPRNSTGLEVLGAPIGDAAFLDSILTKKFADASNFCENICKVGDPQISLALLRLCAGTCRVLHLMKVVAPTTISPYVTRLDEKMADVFTRCTGVQLTSMSLRQVFLPIRLGGLGLRGGEPLAAPSFITAFTRFCAVGTSLLQLPANFWSACKEEFSSIVAKFSPEAPPTTSQALHWLAENRAVPSLHPIFCSLTWWSAQIHQRAWDQMMDEASARDRARIRCIGGANASQWLEPCPSEALGLHFTTGEFSILLKWWLGQPLLPVTEQHICRSCGEPQDVYGDHMLSCRKAGLIQRHTAIVQQLWHQSTAAGIQAVPEVSLDGRTRAADLLLSHWKGGGPCALDVAVVHPLAPSLPARSVKTGMEAIDHMVHVKVTKYGQSCNESKVSFLPFVLSTFGQLGADADHYCRHLASGLRLSANVGERKGIELMQQLQTTLKREVARMLLQGCPFSVPADDEGDTEPCPSEVALLNDLVEEYELLAAVASERPSIPCQEPTAMIVG